MFIEIFVLIAGVLPGRLLRGSKKAVRLVSRISLFVIHAMLFVLGAKMGADDAIFRELGRLGATALALGFLCTVGSAAAVVPANRFFRREREGAQSEGPRKKNRLAKGILSSAYILACFCLGLALARLGLLPHWLTGGNLSLYVLWVMLFVIGMGIGFDLSALRIIKDMGLRVALIPGLAALGTLAGCFLASAILPDLGARQSLIAGTGFGYYSLASVVVAEAAGEDLGTITLIANVFRELFALVAAPLLARLFGPLAPVSAAGAPAMDTCLPAIVFASGERYGIVALFSGLVFTMLVPLLLPLVLKI